MHAAERALSQEQRMMRATIRDFVDHEVTPFIRKNWQLEWDMKPENRPSRELLEGAHKIGVRTLGIPEEFGGTPIEPEGEVQTFAMVAEEISRGDSGLADKLVQIWKISKLLQNIAPRHLQERWFPLIVEDPSFLLAHCLTEPRGASDRWLPYDVPEAMMHTKASLKGDQWVINGRKQFITNGYDAKLYVVYATTKPGAGMTKGTSSFLIPRDTPGLSVARCNETLGGRFMNNGEIVFEDCAVPKDHCLVENIALTRAGIYFRPGKIIVAAKNLGVGMAAFERTADYVQNYVQGGRILIKHQAVALRLAEMATKLAAVRALLNEAVRAVDEGAHDAEALCVMVKMFGIEKLLRDASLFLHRDATVDISKFKVVKSMFPETAGIYAGPE
jgi:alkylation response protein AidB-like acyl-CoA dehydrogenase